MEEGEEDEKEGQGLECGKREGKITDGEIRSDYCLFASHRTTKDGGKGKKRRRKERNKRQRGMKNESSELPRRTDCRHGEKKSVC